ncbi:MAG: peptidase T [Bacilli bacterium]|jgi:tripeptide aminopeptidase|nr:peptidase T [Bacilli bacterium]MDD4482587.1 peptidase T [Bacilli bacterium]MDY0364109.1 peptidase T [Bacilli bacterium]
MKTHERFLRYVETDTTSNPHSHTHPSSKSQLLFAKQLAKELKELKLSNVTLTDKGYVYGTITKNTNEEFDSIAFIAHMDTSNDFSGANIKPRIIENYDGSDVILNEKLNIIMSSNEFPFLKNLKGESLIVTDGTTLLGADDKAGIAEIMSMIEHLNNHPEIKHGEIKICFTPDEEIGEGPLFFDNDYFNVDYAYTVDGGEHNVINYENFNAASAIVTINGINIHPGSAKGHMINSISVANEFDSLLPKNQRPELTENYEGFNHLNEIKGNVEKTTMYYIIRNHSYDLFEKQKLDFINIKSTLNKKYKKEIISLDIKNSYFNMYESIKNNMRCIEVASSAINKSGSIPKYVPIRGGTDGAQISLMGIPCPNIGTGGHNCHGKYECITIEEMKRCVNVLINIVQEAKKL